MKMFKLLVITALMGGLAACKPGPITLGRSQPVQPVQNSQGQVVKNSQGQVQYTNYKVNKKQMLTVAPSTGSDLVTNKIKAAYAQDPVLSKQKIDVETHRGEVTLSGQVANNSIKSYAIKVARNTKGVLAVKAKHLMVVNKQ